MSYSTANPPRMAVPGVGGGFSLWFYDDADAATTVRGSTYFSDGDALGMKVGDIVIQSDSAGATVGHIYIVASVTAGGAANVTDGTAIDATDT